MGPKFAKIIFDTLVESSCGLVTLVISDNEVSDLSALSAVNGSSLLFHSFIFLTHAMENIQRPPVADCWLASQS